MITSSWQKLLHFLPPVKRSCLKKTHTKKPLGNKNLPRTTWWVFSMIFSVKFCGDISWLYLLLDMSAAQNVHPFVLDLFFWLIRNHRILFHIRLIHNFERIQIPIISIGDAFIHVEMSRIQMNFQKFPTLLGHSRREKDRGKDFRVVQDWKSLRKTSFSVRFSVFSSRFSWLRSFSDKQKFCFCFSDLLSHAVLPGDDRESGTRGILQSPILNIEWCLGIFFKIA